MTSSPLKALVVKPKLKHTATVIFLHGLGDSGHGWEPVAEMLGRDEALGHIKWVLSHAPRQPVTVNFGMKMPSWYDILTLDDIEERQEDDKGLQTSATSINELIKSELNSSPGLDVSRIILGGFSQGGALALLTGLTTEHKLGGLIGLSSYLPLRSKVKETLSENAKKLPIFMGHGTADPVVKFKFGELTYQFLKNELGLPNVESDKVAGPGVRFEKYEGLGHSADPLELKHMSAWLKSLVP